MIIKYLDNGKFEVTQLESHEKGIICQTKYSEGVYYIETGDKPIIHADISFSNPDPSKRLDAVQNITKNQMTIIFMNTVTDEYEYIANWSVKLTFDKAGQQKKPVIKPFGEMFQRI